MISVGRNSGPACDCPLRSSQWRSTVTGQRRGLADRGSDQLVTGPELVVRQT